MLTSTLYDRHVTQLFDLATRVAGALKRAGIPYRIVGGLAAYHHVNEVDPIAARLTRDIDMLVERRDLPRIAEATRELGMVFRHVAGVDMLVDAQEPKARRAVHLLFAGEKVRQESIEPLPGMSPAAETPEGLLFSPIADLLRMKLASFRQKDQVHVRDMDGVGLITPEMEAGLSDPLRDRLRQVRATE